MGEHVMKKLRRWVDDIAAEKIASVIPELEEFYDSDVSEKTKIELSFKLLQHVSYAAHKHDESALKFGRDLSIITILICRNMTTVSNGKKFFSSIYHIIVCLLKMSLYHEGLEISEYLMPERRILRADETITISHIYGPISNLWHRIAANLLKTAGLASRENYELLVAIVRHELKLTKLIDTKNSANFLDRIAWHLKKINHHDDDTRYEKKFKDSLIDCARGSSLTFDDERSTWRAICELIPLLIGKSIDSTNINSIVDNYHRYFDAFRGSIMRHKDYTAMFVLWERLCEIMLRSFENFTENCVDEIERWIVEFNVTLRIEDRSIIETYCGVIHELLVSILNYWEECVKNEETSRHATSDMIMAVLKLMIAHAAVYGKIKTNSCCPNCRIKTEIVKELRLRIKCLSLVSRCGPALTCEKIRNIAIDMVEASPRFFEILKNGNCEHRTTLWPLFGAVVYNMGVNCEKSFPSCSIKFYTILSRSLAINEDPRRSKSLWGFEDPLGMILHRLSSVCVKNKKYDRAKSAISINALISQDNANSKAYSDWIALKHKDPTMERLTIIECLRISEPTIKNVRIEDYDLAKVCRREIKALQESRIYSSLSIMAVLDELENLNCDYTDYARGVQLLVYHDLNFTKNSPVGSYIRKASAIPPSENESSGMNFHSIRAMMKFYEFVARTRELGRETELDMRTALIALTTRVKNSESNGRSEYEIVPAYGTINMTIASEFSSYLTEAFREWRIFVDSDCRENLENWEIPYALHAIKIAGEYARLYQFDNLENEAWRIVYKLANEISDSRSVVYATTRSLTSTNFHSSWIARTEKHHVAKLENFDDRETRELVTRYRLCLANYYYENDEIGRGDETFARATSRMEIKFMHDYENFLLLNEIELGHRLGRTKNDDQTSYTNLIIRCLYTLITMEDSADSIVYGCKEKQLYGYEMLLNFTNSLALRMNGLLGYREISAHLVKRLGTAQKMVNPMRVAECLKYLCYIDLSRGELENCEVKLQGLRYILAMENFDTTTTTTKKGKFSPRRDKNDEITISPTSPVSHHADLIRDIGQSDASPVLRKVTFVEPDFMLHSDNCDCTICGNIRYQYLVFACNYIRAQLFALRRNSTAAFQHFHGAMRIKRYILMKREIVERSKKYDKFLISCCRNRSDAIEYIMFHLDYSRFLEWSMPTSSNEATEIVLDALELCEKYKLQNHPIYVSVNESLLQRRFEKVFTEDDRSKFTVPDMNKTDINRYEDAPLADLGLCVTPSRGEAIEKRPNPVRRRKTPAFLKLDRVPIDELAEIVSATTITNYPSTRNRRLRRKIYDDADYSDDNNEETEKFTKSSIPTIIVSQAPSDDAKIPDEKSHGGARSQITTTKNKKSQLKMKMRKKDGRSNVKTIVKVDDVVEIFNDMSINNSVESNFPSSDGSIKPEGLSENSDSSLSLARTLADPTIIGNEEDSIGRRISARLRKKSQETTPGGKNSKN